MPEVFHHGAASKLLIHGHGMLIEYAMIRLFYNHFGCFFMPPPLGAGGIMFSGCPSVRPSEAWKTLFWPVHGSVGPPDQP